MNADCHNHPAASLKARSTPAYCSCPPAQTRRDRRSPKCARRRRGFGFGAETSTVGTKRRWRSRRSSSGWARALPATFSGGLRGARAAAARVPTFATFPWRFMPERRIGKIDAISKKCAPPRPYRSLPSRAAGESRRGIYPLLPPLAGKFTTAPRVGRICASSAARSLCMNGLESFRSFAAAPSLISA
jgi:hypothetical protein